MRAVRAEPGGQRGARGSQIVGQRTVALGLIGNFAIPAGMDDTGSLTEGRVEELKEICERRGGLQEWSFLLDAFQAERDQAITIDTAQVRFRTAKRGYVLIDAPGHLEFLRNIMFSGAAEAMRSLVIGVNAGCRNRPYAMRRFCRWLEFRR